MVFLDRKLQVKITSASISQALTVIAQQGIDLLQVHWEDELTVSALIRAGKLEELKQLLSDRGESLQVIGTVGALWQILGLMRRPVLVAGMVMFLLFTIFLPTVVLFICVEGNQQVPDRYILQCAQEYGVYFGASRRDIRSEVLKNGLLQMIPQLQWAGVNTKGCVAVISVREKSPPKNQNNEQYGNIVASCDGIVRKITVLKGMPVCTVGQAVEKGQLLVSGYTDCGLKLLATGARAEVFGDTKRTLTVVTPTNNPVRGNCNAQRKRYSIQIGKKLIKMYNSSRIPLAGCDIIRKRDFITLPGGFILPVALITEQVTNYETEDHICEESCDLSWLRTSADAYLLDQLVIGTVTDCFEIPRREAGIYTLDVHYSCYELIGKVSNKEIIK